MKRTIRLNESDLVRIVEGAARKMLNELDWKTYANAAKASEDRTEDDDDNNVRFRGYSRAVRFNRAAAEALNRDYLNGSKDEWPSGRVFSKAYEDEPYMTGSDKIPRGNHHVWADLNPFRHEYKVGLSSAMTGRNGRPYRATPADMDGYTWSYGTGTKGIHGFKKSSAKDMDIPGDMADTYYGTPMFDRYYGTAREINDYEDGRYRYEKGRGWTK